LLDNLADLDSTSNGAISIGKLEGKLSGERPRPWDRSTTKAVKKKMQKACYDLALSKPEGAHPKMAKELRKWYLPSFSRIHTDRAFRLLARVSSLVPPKVLAALLRTWWDGWTTSARMHEAGGVRHCPWCHLGEGDKIQHFCRCKELQSWRCRKLRLPWEAEEGPRKEQFFVLGYLDGCDNKTITLRCLALAATYQAYNCIKHWTRELNAEEASRALNQSLKEIVTKDKKLATAVDACWSN